MNLSNEALSAVIGAIMPPVISLVNQHVENHKARYWIAQATCVVVGVVITVLTGQLEPNDFIKSTLLVITTANVTYKNFWQEQ